MNTLLLTLGLFGLAMIGMSVGVIFSDRRLHGSCGGPNSDDCLCEIEKRRACAREARAQGSESEVWVPPSLR